MCFWVWFKYQLDYTWFIRFDSIRSDWIRFKHYSDDVCLLIYNIYIYIYFVIAESTRLARK